MHQQSTPKAAIYCRVSTARQEHNCSLSTQLAGCRAYAEAHGYTVAEQHIYQEVGNSFTLDRPELTRLRAELETGRIQAVVVYAFDRWSSQNTDLYRLLTDIELAGASLESVTEGVFENTAIGRATLSLRTTGRELWREAHTERTKRGRLARINSGKLLAGKKPAYGYKWREPLPGESKSHDAYDPDPRTAPILRRMYELMAAGGSLSGIKRAFEAEGIPAPLGGPRWSPGMIRRILKNERYKGEATMCQTITVRMPDGKRTTRPRPESERIRMPAGTVPALVSAELWERAYAQIAAGSRNNPRRLPDPDRYLLRGFVRCEHCDKRLGTMSDHYRTNPMNLREHGCPSRQILSAKLDGAVWELIEQIVKHPDRIIDKIVADFTSETDPTQKERETLAKVLKDIERERRNQTFAVGQIDDPELAAPNIARLKQLGKEAQSLQAQLAELDQRRAGWKSGLAAAARLTEAFHTEQERLDNLTMDERRAILNWLGVEVTLHAGTATPRWTMTTRIKLPTWIDPEPAADDTGAPLAPGQRYRTTGGFPEADHPEFTALLQQLAGENQSFPTG